MDLPKVNFIDAAKINSSCSRTPGGEEQTFTTIG